MDISFKKLDKLGGPGIIVSAVILAFICLLLIFYNSEVGMANDIGIREPVFTDVDFSSVPASVVDDAGKIADELVGNRGERY